MPLMFSYGTLQDPAVQLATFGRVLRGHPDSLIGFRRSQVAITTPELIAQTGRTHHDNASYTGNAEERLEGNVEREADYVRVRVWAASGRETWVYVHINSAPPQKL